MGCVGTIEEFGKNEKKYIIEPSKSKKLHKEQMNNQEIQKIEDEKIDDK